MKFNLIGSYSRLYALNGMTMSPKKLFEQYEDYLCLTKDLPRDSARHLVATYGTTSHRL